MNYINYRASLYHTFQKLTQDRELTVVYFGGSVTAGYGSSDSNEYSWRALIGKWLSAEFPNARVNNINRALGESGTYLGANRVQMDIIPAKPDLLFVEYSINDRYYKSTYEKAASQFETIIREVKTALSETDIVTVLVTDQRCLETNQEGKLHIQAQAHEDIAKAYNIPTIHAGRYLAAVVDYSTANWSNYAIDIVHLNDAGYKIYYQIIREFMYNSLFCTDFLKPQEQFVMSPIISDDLFDGDRTYIIPSQDLLAKSNALGGAGVTWTNESIFSNAAISEKCGRFQFGDDSDMLVIRFHGTEISAYIFQSNVSWLVSVDGGEYKTVKSGSHNPTIFAEGLTPGEHTVKIKPTTKVNVSVGAIFTRNAALATRKGS
ncbi:MAG: hypothetical protein IJZ80_07325 [Clostridia bacterium]|nr:hypothetical protein [Clostridia bacterium]